MLSLGLAGVGLMTLWWHASTTNTTKDQPRRTLPVMPTTAQSATAKAGGGRATDKPAFRPRPAVLAVQPATNASPPSAADPGGPAQRPGEARSGAEIGPVAGEPGMLSAEQILQAMHESYARLGSYTDRGRLTRTLHEIGRVYVDASFRTFFKRPRFYRFEWMGVIDPYRQSYWSNPSGLLVRRANGVVTRHTTFAAALPYEEASPAYHTVRLLTLDAALLQREILTAPQRLADETIDGVDCFHLSGVAPPRNGERQLWIGQNDFLLRRIRTVGPHAYALRPGSQYGTGTDTVQIDYLDVTTELNLPDELFYFAQP